MVDVGTDHARLPLWLLQNGVTTDITAVDIADGPLQKAIALTEYVGLREQLRILKADGLTMLCEDDCDTVIIAGMGGDSIIKILNDSPWSLQKHLLLQPMSRADRVLDYLQSENIIPAEARVLDGRREFVIYECGQPPAASSGTPFQKGIGVKI